jgi:hypothetical protein
MYVDELIISREYSIENMSKNYYFLLEAIRGKPISVKGKTAEEIFKILYKDRDLRRHLEILSSKIPSEVVQFHRYVKDGGCSRWVWSIAFSHPVSPMIKEYFLIKGGSTRGGYHTYLYDSYPTKVELTAAYNRIGMDWISEKFKNTYSFSNHPLPEPKVRPDFFTFSKKRIFIEEVDHGPLFSRFEQDADFEPVYEEEKRLSDLNKKVKLQKEKEQKVANKKKKKRITMPRR